MSVTKLEDDKLWQQASRIAETAYGLLADFPEEEKWGMQSKLRQRAFEVSSDVAEGLGSLDPRDARWHFGLARRSLFGLKNALILASKAGYINLDPKLMHEIEQTVAALDMHIDEATNNIPEWYKINDPAEKSK